MNPVESRPLRYFVAVAEELNFARAAERLGIASPALSRAVAQLERQLGVRLLERSTRHVALTGAGAQLLDDAREALAALDAATRRVRRAAAADRPGSLVLAVKADVEGGLLEDLLAAFAADPAAVPVRVTFTGWREQPALLRSGEADVAIVLEPFDDAELDYEPLLEEPQLLAMATGHPLAGRPRLCLADLDAGHERPEGTHVYIPVGGERPAAADMTQMLRHVELGRMLLLSPASLAERQARPQLVWRPVADAPPARFAVAWPRRSRSLAVAAFVRAASDVAAGRGNRRMATAK